MAERINKGMKSAEEVERNARIVQEIESHIEGMEDVRTGVLHGIGLSFSPKCTISVLSGSPQAGPLVFFAGSCFPHHHLALVGSWVFGKGLRCQF